MASEADIVQHDTACLACGAAITATIRITRRGDEQELHCLCGYVNKFRYWIINQPKEL